MLINGIVILNIVSHVWFLILEMFLWRKPLGMKTFKLTPEFAERSAGLAANQGLYNGFLAAGMIWGLLSSDPTQARSIELFFLGCISVAGIYGAATVNKRIFFIQAIPAMTGLGLICLN